MGNREEADLVVVALREILHYQDKNLIGPNTWGATNFPNACRDIERVFSVAAELLELPVEYLPEESIHKILPSISMIRNCLTIMENHSLSGDVDRKRKAIESDVHKAAEILYKEACTYIPYLAYRHGDENNGIAVLKTAKGKAESSLLVIENKKKEMDAIISAAKNAAADMTVNTFTHEFDSEAGALKRQSVKWLLATVVFAILTILAAVWYWPTVSSNEGTLELLRNIIGKSVVIAVLFTGTVWCGRIYRALMHQSTTNRHRALSLKTFQAFVAATNDDRVKDSVLMAAARTIFGRATTGLVSETGPEREPEVNYVEIGRPSSD
ncbi:MAG: hypothetical protein OXU26_12345 [Acidobacteriota bacterium]|nr:hypothetical protein [Acidobacteriota bacterium]